MLSYHHHKECIFCPLMLYSRKLRHCWGRKYFKETLALSFIQLSHPFPSKCQHFCLDPRPPSTPYKHDDVILERSLKVIVVFKYTPSTRTKVNPLVNLKEKSNTIWSHLGISSQEWFFHETNINIVECFLSRISTKINIIYVSWKTSTKFEDTSSVR